ncbi:MAG: hypothetical protein JKY45_05700 [Emcibacter sp.]|nr:hypothetical protein [Emcibacter sp.]
MSRNHFEDNLSVAVAAFLRRAEPGCMWWHSPNGGTRNKQEAARLKLMGVLKGVPDYIFILPDCSIGFIELKLEKTPHHAKSYQSKEQKVFHKDFEDLTDRKDRYAVCRSINEVARALDGWGIIWMGRLIDKPIKVV